MRSRFLHVLVIACALTPGALGAREPSLPFSRDLEGTLAVAETSGKPVAVVFLAAWCPWCRQMRRDTLAAPAVTAMTDDFLWVLIDVDRSPRTARRFAVTSIPQIHVLDPDGSTRARLVGLRSAAQLEAELTPLLPGPEPSTEAVASPPPSTGRREGTTLVETPDGYRGMSLCFSHVGYGPLEFHSQSQFQALRLGIRPRPPSTLGKGQFEVRGASTWVNVWATGDGYTLDYEMLQAALALAYGPTDRLEIELEFQERTRFGGGMDGLIQGFHDLFGIDQNGRDLVPKGEFVFELDPPDDRVPVALGGGDRGTFSRSVQLALQHNVSCGTAALPALSYAVSARVETEDADFVGGGDLDLGASVALARRFGEVYLYGTLGYAWFGHDDFRGLRLRNSQFTGLFALEWRYVAKQSVILQYLLTEGLIDDFEPFSDPSSEITLGWKWEVLERGVLEVGIVENVVSHDNSPDFGLQVAFSQRF